MAKPLGGVRGGGNHRLFRRFAAVFGNGKTHGPPRIWAKTSKTIRVKFFPWSPWQRGFDAFYRASEVFYMLSVGFLSAPCGFGIGAL